MEVVKEIKTQVTDGAEEEDGESSVWKKKEPKNKEFSIDKPD